MQRAAFLFVLCAGAALCARHDAAAQTNLEYWSDTPLDARSNALGEAFVAVASGPAAMLYNVAGLEMSPGAALEVNSVQNDVFASAQLNALHHYGAAATLATSAWGGVGVRLSSFAYGGVAQTSIDDATLAYAGAVSPTLDAGVGLGIVDATNVTGMDNTQKSAPYLALGIRYHDSILHSSVPDIFAFAVSLDHLGAPLFTGDSSIHAVDLARSLRAGVSWRIAQPDTTAWASEFLSAMVAGQFKKILNEQSFSTDQLTTNKGYWSLGLEVGAWDMLFLRFGLQYRPFDSPFSFRDNAQQNVGAGVRLPLHKLFGGATPIWLNVDYANMFLLNNQHVQEMTAGLRIDHDFFPAPPADEGQQ